MQQLCPRDRPIVEVRNLRKEYPLDGETVVALKRINLQILRGEICCVFGTSGSGKSTLLNQLAGMEKPTRGEVRISPGTLYGSLSKMERDGLIRLVREQNKRKVYVITDLGREVLGLEMRRIERLYQTMREARAS